MMHELTEKLRFYLGPSPKELEEADGWIHRWLSEKAKELGFVKPGFSDKKGYTEYFMKVLGLSSSVVGKPKDSEVWCEHMSWEAWGNYKFCPFCGTPRPNPKTLKQRVQEYLTSKNVGLVKFGLGYPPDDFAGDLAEIAEKHFKEERL